MDYSPRDERFNANTYATYEEIDERQVLALGVCCLSNGKPAASNFGIF